MKALIMNTKLEFREIRTVLGWLWNNQFNIYLTAMFVTVAVRFGMNVWDLIKLLRYTG